MARPAVFTWPTPDDNGIALVQTTGGAGGMILNGALVNHQQPSFAEFPGVSRVVSLTSASNNSAITFTITGILDGGIVSEAISGPNSNTVESTQVFDKVTSIVVDGAITSVSAGSGSTGYTHWFNGNYHSTVLGLALSVNVTGTIDYTFQTTLNDVNDSSVTVALFAPITGTAGHPAFPTDMVGATTDQLAYYNFVTRYSRILINSSGADGELVAVFLQQGIT